MTNSQAWDYAVGMIKVDGFEPTEDFKEYIEKEKRGEATMDDIKKFLDKKYKAKDDTEGVSECFCSMDTKEDGLEIQKELRAEWDNPFAPMTEQQILDELAESREEAEKCNGREFDEFMDDLEAKYDLV